MTTMLISEGKDYRLEQARTPDGALVELKVPKLHAPSVEVAWKGLASQDYDHAIGIALISAMAGSSMRAAYSMKELEASLDPLDTLDLSHRQQPALSYVDLDVIAHWVDKVIEDHELAAAVREVTDQESVYGKALPFVKGLLQERLVAYRQCLSQAYPEAEPDALPEALASALAKD